MVIYLANSIAISKQVCITQKTAWFMLHRIKNASTSAIFDNQFQGTTEIDEVYIGGSEKNRHSKRQKIDW